MHSSRRLVNLVTVIVASAVLLLFAVTELLATAVLDNNYPLYIELSEAGGLLENKQVTYRGVGVGEIVDVTLCDDSSTSHGPDCADVENVRVEMGIQNGVQIPVGVDVVVLRQSAVGEQALDFRPQSPTGPETTYYAENDVVVPEDVTLPTKPQDLLELANEVFAPVDEENAGIVIAELADALEGRSNDIQRIMADSAVLSEAVGDNGGDYDRFFAAGRIVNASLAENREILAQLITDLADGAVLIGDIRAEVDGLLDSAPTVLAATSSILERGDANLACIIEDVANLNEFVSRPENMANLEEGIRVNEYFFEGFRLIGPLSAQGDPWLRVQLIMEPEPPAQRFVPSRPIPPTLPGGACESVLGPGAGSAVQPNHQLAVPEGQVIRPQDDRQTTYVGVTNEEELAARTARESGGEPTPTPTPGPAGPTEDPTAPPVIPDVGPIASLPTSSGGPTNALVLVALALVGFLAVVGGSSAASRVARSRARPPRERSDRAGPDRAGSDRTGSDRGGDDTDG